MPDEPKSHATNGGSRHGTASTDQREVLLAAAAGLQKSVESLAEKIDKADAFAEETRKIAESSAATAVETGKVSKRISKVVKTLVVVVIVLALALVGVFVNGVRTTRANSKAQRIQEYQVANCVSSNDARRASAELWNFVLDLSVKNSKEPQTPQTRKTIQAFKDKVATTYAQKDCTQVPEGRVK